MPDLGVETQGPAADLIYPTRTLRGRLQSTAVWRALIDWFWGPVHAFLWEYVIHAPAKIAYWRSGFPKELHPGLTRSGFELVQGDPDFVKFAEDLRAAIPEEALQSERRRLLSSDDEMSYGCRILPHLDDVARYKILRFALSPKVLDYVITYMRVVPRLSQVNLMFNVAHPSIREAMGSAQWHRDDNGRYRGVNIFMCLSDVDADSGLYSAIPANDIPIHSVIPAAVKNMADSPWRRGRISDAQMDRYVDPAKIKKLQGPPGTTAVVDPHLVYHKGGYCSKRDRLMLQIHYCTEEGAGLDSAHITDWVDFNHPEVKPLLADPLKRFILSGPRNSSFKAVRKFWWLLNRYILSYYLQPNKSEERSVQQDESEPIFRRAKANVV